MPIVVDGQTYQYRGTVEATMGSGDSAEHLNFTVYTDLQGCECWLNEDKGQWYFYRGSMNSDSLPKVVATHEVFEPTKFEILAKKTPPVRFSWVALEQRQLEEREPFRGTDQAMLMGADLKLAVPLLKAAEGDVYYGPNFPASETPRRLVAPGTSTGPTAALVLLLGLAAVMGWAVWAKSPIPIRIFWWAGPLLGCLRLMTARHSFVNTVCGLASGVFFFHFATHGLDYLVTREWEEALVPIFESARVAGACLLFLALRALLPRYYLALLDGANTGGGNAWLTYFGGQCMVGMVLESGDYFVWFNWYASIPTWSWIWPIFLFFGVKAKFKDYRKAPVERDGFRSLLYRTRALTKQGLKESRASAERLKSWADDLEDALSLSADPAVRAFTPLAPCLLRWHQQIEGLEDVDPEDLDEDIMQQLEADLGAISEDFEDLLVYLDAWPDQKRDLRTLRFSPRLATWNS